MEYRCEIDPCGSETSLSPSMHVLGNLLMSWSPIAGAFGIIATLNNV